MTANWKPNPSAVGLSNAAIRSEPAVSKIRVRFRNDGGKAYARAEVHAEYRIPMADATAVTFAWADEAGDHTGSHTFAGNPDDRSWTIPTGKNVRTKWVEMKPMK